MSWSINATGTPEEVVKALQEESSHYTGQCKAECDGAVPHIIALVQQNYVTPAGAARSPPYRCVKIKLHAHGSGCSGDGAELNRECAVQIETIYQ